MSWRTPDSKREEPLFFMGTPFDVPFTLRPIVCNSVASSSKEFQNEWLPFCFLSWSATGYSSEKVHPVVNPGFVTTVPFLLFHSAVIIVPLMSKLLHQASSHSSYKLPCRREIRNLQVDQRSGLMQKRSGTTGQRLHYYV